MRKIKVVEHGAISDLQKVDFSDLIRTFPLLVGKGHGTATGMVRFHWHVEDGFGAFIPAGGMMPHREPHVPVDQQVMHAVVEIEVRKALEEEARAEEFTLHTCEDLHGTCMVNGRSQEARR